MSDTQQPVGDRIYLDFAAATPMDKRVVDVMQPFYTEKFYNPSALYKGARLVKVDLDAARSSVARSIGARPSEVVFTAGGTESANLAIYGIMKRHPTGEVLLSSIEHEAVLRPAQDYSSRHIPVNRLGVVDPSTIQSMITAKTVLVSVMLVNNEVGSIQPIQEIARIIQKARTQRLQSGNHTPLYLHTDACQAPMYLDTNVARLGVDLMTLNGGKIHGPKQSGMLYIKSGVVLLPVTTGGGQEFGYRSGTENVAFAVGFATALELAGAGRSQRSKATSNLRDWFIHELEKTLGAQITGHRTHRVANNIHALFTGVDNERVLFALDANGIDAAAGSACSASKDTSSHVLLAMGYSDSEARSSLRMTLGSTTTRDQLVIVVEKLTHALTA